MENLNINLGNKINFSSPLEAMGLGAKANMFNGALPIHFELAKKLRDNQTATEKFLWNLLVKNKRSQIQTTTSSFILYC